MIELYNTRTRKKEVLKPIRKEKVGIYSCGPTVYWNQHIGHMYAYTQWDSLVRFLKYLGYQVKWVMNITDVGHIVSDEDIGEDKMEKGAKREGLSVWQIAEKYIAQFLESMDLLNIQRPDVLCRATEHIEQQIDLIKKMEKRGFTYQTKTGIVFDTSKFAAYADFGRLDLEKQKAGSRVEIDPEKKKPWDFLLWVTNQPNHIMQWDSPWGKGFPGWHIECTAMSTHYLGKRFDIHTGGLEHIPVHHTNEIAQGFGAFGKHTANFWIHNAWLTIKGEKMSKSKGGFHTAQEVKEKGYNLLALRYLILTSHYRKGLDFTWEALDGAQKALNRLYQAFASWPKGEVSKSDPEIKQWQKKFIDALSDDFNWPQAMAVVWEIAKDKKLSREKKKLVLTDLDQVLGLKLKARKAVIPRAVLELVKKRNQLRKDKKWSEADTVRREIEKKGFKIKDGVKGTAVFPGDFLS